MNPSIGGRPRATYDAAAVSRHSAGIELPAYGLCAGLVPSTGVARPLDWSATPSASSSQTFYCGMIVGNTNRVQRTKILAEITDLPYLLPYSWSVWPAAPPDLPPHAGFRHPVVPR